MGKSIDEHLNDEPTEEVAEAPAEVAEQPAEQEAEEDLNPRRDEHGRFAKKETDEKVEQDEPAEPGPSPEQPDEATQGQMAALKAERQKRQEAEQRIQQIEAYYRQQMQAQQKPNEATPDFWDDPQAVISRQIREEMQAFAQQQQQQQAIQRVDQSEKTFRAEHPDFDEKLAAFRDAVQANPRLAQEMAEADNPAQYAYERGKTALALSQHGSIDQIIAAERAKWEAETKAALNPPPLPNSTATDGSVGGRSGPAWAGPKPITDLLG